MTDSENCLLEEFVQVFLDYYDMKENFDLHKLIVKMNGVLEFNSSMSEFDYPIVEKIKDDSFRIIVSTNKVEVMQNLDIAVSIGIIVLSMGFIVDDKKWQYQQNNMYYTPTRKDLLLAKKFAYSLLMPKLKMIKIAQEYTNGNIVYTQDIAKYFNVSPGVASERMLELKLIKW